MYARNSFLAVAGTAALIAGFALFVADFSSGFTWIAGTLLWLLGCVLVMCWAAERVYTAARTPREPPQRETTVHVMKKAS